MFIDPLYLVFIIPAFLLGLVAQILVKSRYKKYSKVISRSGMTGAQAAQTVLSVNGVSGVGIGSIAGELTDNYNPQTNIISLSQGVHSENSIAAVGIAAHEAGHAVQHAQGYSPIKIRTAIIPVCKFGSWLGPILIIVGSIIAYSAGKAGYRIGNFLYLAGIILFATVALFQLVTLPVEINASRRAMRALESSGTLESDELKGAGKVLTAAALTYVAALFTSIMTLLYYIIRFSPSRRD
ncbi:MAG: zinc metallopeptidase [Clostridia bacterium]|jgi:Zn-dependent membrane protease YugP|nr:zinc metallopeptidase [Clostridia bacterium]